MPALDGLETSCKCYELQDRTVYCISEKHLYGAHCSVLLSVFVLNKALVLFSDFSRPYEATSTSISDGRCCWC